MEHYQECYYCKTKILHCEHSEQCDEPNNSVCDNNECKLRASVDYWKLKFEDATTTIEQKNQLLGMFRIFLLSPHQMDKLVSDRTFNIVTTAKEFCIARRPYWDQSSPETLLVFITICQKIMEEMSDICNKKISKNQIKKELIEKTRERIRKFETAQQTAKQNGKMLTPFQKIVAKLQKSMKCSYEDAVIYAKQTGVKE